MKLLADPVLPFALPFAALIAAAGVFAAHGKHVAPGHPETSAPAELVRIIQGKRQFTEEDVPVVVDVMHRAGIDQFVCRIDPSNGQLLVALHDELTPHLDIKPGSCPNPLQIRGGGGALAALPTGILGNAFDVTQVDLGSVRLGRAAPQAGMTGLEVVPNHITFADVGAPFDGSQCNCAAFGPDGILDILVQYNKQQVIDVLGLGSEPDGNSVPLRTTGLAGGGSAVFSAVDCVRIQQQ
jgi:hypothetical protein